MVPAMTTMPVGSGWAWSRPVPWLLAWRYFRTTRRDASIRFLSTMTTGGIALGVAALVLAVAALSGFQAELLRQILSQTPALQIQLQDGEATRIGEAMRIARETVPGSRLQQILVGRGLVAEGGGLEPVEVVGYEREIPVWFPGLERTGDPGIVLPAALARVWGVTAGDTVELVSPRPQLSPVGLIPRSRFLRVEGVYDADRVEEEERRVAVPLAVAQTLLWPGDRRIDIEPGSGTSVTRSAAALRDRLGEDAAVVTAR